MQLNNLVVFGATGRVGTQVVKFAIEKGFNVTAFVRNSSDYPFNHENLSLFAGDVTDYSKVNEIIKQNNLVISALGARANFSISEGVNNIVKAMQNNNVHRIIAIGGAGLLLTNDNNMRRDGNDYPEYLKKISADHLKTFNLLKESNLDWTYVCPPNITDGDRIGNYRIQSEYILENTKNINTADIADFMVNELVNNSFIRQRVAISY